MNTPAKTSAAAERERVVVFDTTMRDGEQSPGASMSLQEKLELSKILEEMRSIADGASDGGAKWHERRLDLLDIVLENTIVEYGELSSAMRVTRTGLEGLGLKPTLLSMALIDHLFDVVERHKERVDLAAIMPTVRWTATASELPRTARQLTPTP